MKCALALVAAIVVVAASAATPAPLALHEIQPGAYEIVSKDTLVRYGVIHMGVSEYWGTFPGATGTLVIDPKALAQAKLDVKVPIATVETTNRELDGELFSDEFFDGEKYPVMHFIATQVTPTGATTIKVTGNLTIHGVTKPISLEATFTGAGRNPFSNASIIGFKAEGVVKRSDFGIGKYVPIVSDATTMTISATFEKNKRDVGALWSPDPELAV